MKIFGYAHETKAALLELYKVTLASNPTLLRELAAFLVECAGSIDQEPGVLVDLFVAKSIVSTSCAYTMRRILRSFRNNFHHLNPSISKAPVQAIAKRNIEDIASIETEIFEHSYLDGKISPKQEKYWDVTPQGTILVNLRPG